MAIVRVENLDGTFSEIDDSTFATPQPVEEAGAIRSLGDTLLKFGRGGANAVKAATDAFGANNAVSRGAGNVAEFLDSGISDEGKQNDRIAAQRLKLSQDQGIGAQLKAVGKNLLDNPIDTLAEGAGSILPTAAAMLLSKGKINPATVGTGLGVVQGAGAVKGSIYEATKQNALANGMNEQEADALATEAQAYSGENADQIGIGAGLGYLAGKTGAETSSLLTGQAKDNLGLLRNTLKGAATEGLTEGAQGGQEALAANLALQRQGEDVPLMRGVAGQAASEAVAGGLTGGAFGAADALTEQPKEQPKDPREQLRDTLLAQNPTGALTQAAAKAVETGAADGALVETDLNNRINTVSTKLSDGVLGEARKTFGNDYVNELLYNYNLAQNPEISADIRGKALANVERMTAQPDFQMIGAPVVDKNKKPAKEIRLLPQQGGENVSNTGQDVTNVAENPDGQPDNLGTGSAGNILSQPIDTGTGNDVAETPTQGGNGDLPVRTADTSGNNAVKSLNELAIGETTKVGDATFRKTENGFERVEDEQNDNVLLNEPKTPNDNRNDGQQGIEPRSGNRNAETSGITTTSPIQKQEPRAVDVPKQSEVSPESQTATGSNGNIRAESDTGALGNVTDNTLEKPQEIITKTPLDAQANEAATSPLNERAEPTQAQKDAGNYKVGRAKVSGLDISIENPQGSKRKGIDPDGKEWESTMTGHYGYIRGVKAKAPDKDRVDVYVKPSTPEDFGGNVYVVNQNDPKTGKFDEPKVMIGYESAEEAKAAYDSNYTKDWKGFDSMAEVPMDKFKSMLDDEKAFQKPVKATKTAAELFGSKKQEELNATPTTMANDVSQPTTINQEGSATDLPSEPAQPLGNSEQLPNEIVGNADNVPATENTIADTEIKDGESRQVGTIGKSQNDAFSVQRNGDKLRILHNNEPVINFDDEQEVSVPLNASIDDIKNAIKNSGQYNKKILTMDSAYKPFGSAGNEQVTNELPASTPTSNLTGNLTGNLTSTPTSEPTVTPTYDKNALRQKYSQEVEGFSNFDEVTQDKVMDIERLSLMDDSRANVDVKQIVSKLRDAIKNTPDKANELLDSTVENFRKQALTTLNNKARGKYEQKIGKSVKDDAIVRAAVLYGAIDLSNEPWANDYYELAKIDPAKINKNQVVDTTVSKTETDAENLTNGDTTTNVAEKTGKSTGGGTLSDNPKDNTKTGEVGGMLESGEVVKTSTGRETTPFPQIKWDNNRQVSNTLKSVDAWLVENAISEAESRGDDFNLLQFKAIDLKNISQSDKDGAELYLFGENIPQVYKKAIKDISESGATTGGTISDNPKEPKQKQPKKEKEPVVDGEQKPVKENKAEKKEPKTESETSVITADYAVETGDVAWLTSELYKDVVEIESIAPDAMPTVFPDDYLIRISLPINDSKIINGVEKNLKRLKFRITDKFQETNESEKIVVSAVISKASGIYDTGEELGGKVKGQVPKKPEPDNDEKKLLKEAEKWLESLHKKNYLNQFSNEEQTFGTMMLKEAIFEKIKYPLNYLVFVLRETYSFSKKDSDKNVIVKALNDEVMAKTVNKSAEKYVTFLNELQSTLHSAKTVEEARSSFLNKYIKINESNRPELTEAGSLFQLIFDSSDWNLARSINSWVTNYADLFGKDENSTDQTNRLVKKDPDVPPRLENIVRVGMKDHREGRDIDTDDFTSAFGFAGSEFGEWVNQIERQQNLNLAYDSLSDMAAITGIDRNIISISGKLGLAIGSRGSKNTRAAAHFEPSSNVINLTKTNGNGTVGHEWFHGLDHNIETGAENESSAILHRQAMNDLAKTLQIRIYADRVNDFLRGVLRDANGEKNRSTPPKNAVFAKINPNGAYATVLHEHVSETTKFKKEADNLDRGKDKIYWGKKAEILARGFESFLFDKTKGGSPYLVGKSRADGYMTPKNGYAGIPYPQGKEREYIAQMYEDFFALIDGKTLKLKTYKVEPKVIEIDGLGYGVVDQNNVGNKFLYSRDSVFGTIEWFKTKELAEVEAAKIKGVERIFTPQLKQVAAVNKEIIDFAQNIDKIMEEMNIVRWPEIKNNSMAESMFFHLKQGWWPTDNRALKEYVAKAYQIKPAEIDLLKLKQGQEDFEAALAKFAGQRITDMRIEGADQKAIYDALLELYNKQPNLDIRTSTSASNQAYSTPLPISFIAGQLARVNANSKVIDPTGGNGLLLINANPKNITTIELEKRRANNMRLMEIGKVIDGDAVKQIEQINDQAADSILTNPPFGSLQSPVPVPSWNGRNYMIGKIDHLIAAKSLKTLADKGRAVIILGANKKVGAINSNDRIFLNWLYANYNVADHFEIEGNLYNRQGAAWPLRMLVIAGRKHSDSVYDMNAVVQRVFTYDELWSRYEQSYKNSEQIVVDTRKQINSTSGANTGSEKLLSGDNGQTGIADNERGVEGSNGNGANDPRRTGSNQNGNTAERGTSSENIAGQNRRGGNDTNGRSGNSENGRPTNGRASGTGTKPTDVSGISDLSDDDIESLFGEVFDAPKKQSIKEKVTPKSELGKKATEKFGSKQKIAKVSTGDSELDNIFAELDKLVEGKTKATSKPNVVNKNVTGNQESKKYPIVNVSETLTDNSEIKPYKLPDFSEYSKAYHSQLYPIIKAVEARGDSIETLSMPMFSRSGDFDEEKYQEYKPIFQRIMEVMRKKFAGVRDQIKNFAIAVLSRYGAKIKSYAMRFVTDIKSEEEKSVSGKKPIIPDPVDNESQVVYRGRSGGNSGGIYVPRKQADALYAALDLFEAEYGDVDDFVMEEVGYDNKEDLYKALGGYQIDALALAISASKDGNGFIIGDDTGVGKGRTAAALMAWAVKSGKVPIFMTIKPDLYTAMYEDLQDIGKGDIKIAITNSKETIKDTKGKVVLKSNPKSAKELYAHIVKNGELPNGAQALFTNYSQFNNPKLSAARREAIASLVRSGKAVIIMDESHNAAGDSQTGEFIKSLITGEGLFGKDSDDTNISAPEDFSPPAVTYLSATFAKRPSNMPVYMRTHLAKAADSPDELISAFSGGGDVLQQIASEMLVKAGSMIRRERSYEGVQFGFVTDEKNAERDARLADEVTNVLRSIVRADRAFAEWAASSEGKSMLATLMPQGYESYDKNGKLDTAINHSLFTSVVHNYVSQLLLSIKSDTAVDYAIDAINRGEKPVFALQNTMGAALSDYAEMAGISVGDTLDNFGWQTILSRGLTSARRVAFRPPTGEDSVRVVVPMNVLPYEVAKEFERGQQLIESFNSTLPASPIDMLRFKISQYSIVTNSDGTQYATKTPPNGANVRPFNIAEITGRKEAVDYSTPTPTYVKREDPDNVDIIRGFANGTIDAVILNSSGSTGISLHASEKFKDQRPRRMIFLQPNPDIAVFKQTIGRIHRTGQVEWPAFTVLATSIPAEKRILAILKKKMKSLFSNTSSGKGSTEIEAVDFINQYGDKIVNEYLSENEDIAGFLGIHISSGDEFLEDKALTASGRASLLSVSEQQDFFDTVEERFKQEIEMRNATGTNTLEMREYDYQAEPLETIMLEEGMDETNPFTESVFATKYSINILGDIPSPDKVRASIDSALNGRTSTEVVNDLVDSLKMRYDEAYNQLILRQTTLNEERNDINATDAEKKAIDERLSSIKSIMEGFATRREQTISALKYRLPIGSGFESMKVGEIESGGVVVGYSVGKATSKTGNPYAPSNIIVHIQRNIPNGRVSIPLSKIESGAGVEIPNVADKYIYLDDMFKLRSATGGKQNRYIITGNLVRFRTTHPEGDIIKFTLNGHTPDTPMIQNGILMPEKYKVDEVAKSGYSFRSKEAATEYLLTMFNALNNQKHESTGYNSYKEIADEAKSLLKLNNDVPQDLLDDIKYSHVLSDSKKSIVLTLNRYDGSLTLSVDTKMQSRLFKSKQLVALIGDLSKHRRNDTFATSQSISSASKIKDLINLLYKFTNLSATEKGADLAKDISKKYYSLSNNKKANDVSDLPKFSRKTTQSKGIQKPLVEAIVNRLRANWKNAPEIIVIEDMNDTRIRQEVRNENERQLSKGAKGQPEGFFDNGVVYVLASEMNKPADVFRTVFHEVLGHYGLRGVYGKELGSILDNIAALRKNDIANKAKKYGLDVNNPKDLRIATEEVLAEMAQKNPQAGFVKRAIAAIRNFLRSIGLNLALSDNDIVVNYLLPARKFVENGGGDGGGGGTKFSRSTNQTDIQSSNKLPDTITVDGIERPTLNSNGKPIHPTREGVENFWKWFGNSKVVDEQGRPKPVYHGTGESIKTFQALRGAIFFTPDNKFADSFAENSAENLRENGIYDEYYDEEAGGSVVYPVYLSLQNPFNPTNASHVQKITNNKDEAKKLSYGEYSTIENYFSEIKAAGFDGFYEKESPSQEFWNIGVFNSPQIKSATGNTGDFNPANPSILFSRSPQKVVSDIVKNAANRDDVIGKAMTVLTGDSAKQFSWAKNIHTQLDKARKDPNGFGRMFNVTQRFETDMRLSAARPAELMPSIIAPSADTATEAINQVLKGDKSQTDKKAVASFLFEGTLAGESVLDGKVFTDDELTAKGATPQQIKMYREARRTINASLDETTAALAYNMVRKYLPNIKNEIRDNPSQARGFILDTLNEIYEDLQNFNEDNQDANDMKPLIESIEDLFDHTDALKNAGYMPLSRFGQYSVTAYDEDGSVAEFYRVETESEAKLKEKELNRDYANVVRGVMPTNPNSIFAGADPDTVSLFLDTIRDSDVFDVNDELFQEWYRNGVSDRSALKRMIKRKGTAGFDTDLEKVLASFITSNSRFVAQNYNRADMLDVLNYLRTDPNYKRKGDVFDEAKALYDYVNNPADPFTFGRSIMFSWFMGGSIASAAVNMTQPFTMTMPWLSQFTGVRNASMQLSKAMKLAGAITWDGKLPEGELGKALLKAREIGLVDPQEVHHLYKAGSGGIINKLAASKDLRTRLTGAATLWGWLFGKGEQFNRNLTFIAAWNVAKEKNMPNAFEFAKRAVEETQGIYDKTNRPNWARGTGSLGAVGAMAFTFKQYSIAYIEMLARMARSGKEGRKAAFVALGVLMLLSGGMGLPFSDDGYDVLDTALQLGGGEGNTRRHIRELALDALGEELGMFALYGASAFMPFDIQGRMGMGNLIPSTAFLMPSNQENRARSGLEILGAGGSLLSDAAETVQGLDNGKDAKDVLVQLMPVAFKNVFKGADMVSDGFYSDTRGRKVVETDEADSLWKAIGFQPSSVASEQKRIQGNQQTISRVKQKESAIAEKLARARFDGDQEKANDALEELREWNEAHPDLPIVINPRQIFTRVRAMHMTRAERQVKATPRELRETLLQ